MWPSLLLSGWLDLGRARKATTGEITGPRPSSKPIPRQRAVIKPVPRLEQDKRTPHGRLDRLLRFHAYDLCEQAASRPALSGDRQGYRNLHFLARRGGAGLFLRRGA